MFSLVPPNVTLTPSQVTVSVTESLQLVCTSYGIPSVVLTWYFGTSKQPLESREGVINITQKTSEYSESLLITTSILTIENITNAYWQGVFICEGFNGVTNLIETPENDTSEVIIPSMNIYLLSLALPVLFSLLKKSSTFELPLFFPSIFPFLFLSSSSKSECHRI